MSDHSIETKLSKNQRTILIGVFAIVALATGILLFVFFSLLFSTQLEQIPSSADAAAFAVLSESGGATSIEPPRLVADFTFTSHTGEPFTLSDFTGKVIVLFFGYTYCPDVCPVTIMEMDQVHNQLGDKADQVEFVFVSVDGERDTPDRLNAYLKTRQVDDYMWGLTATEKELKQIGVDYGLYFDKRQDANTEAFYLVDHTASSYLIDPSGRLTHIFSFGTQQDVITEHILNVLNAG